MASDETKRWKVIYPCQIDVAYPSNKGRLVTHADALLTPTLKEMMQACIEADIRCIAEEDKRHPADMNYGRLRFELKDASGAYANPEVTSKAALARLLARSIAQTSARSARAAADAEAKAAFLAHARVTHPHKWNHPKPEGKAKPGKNKK